MIPRVLALSDAEVADTINGMVDHGTQKSPAFQSLADQTGSKFHAIKSAYYREMKRRRAPLHPAQSDPVVVLRAIRDLIDAYLEHNHG